MARYQVGSSVYELPDNLTEEQLNQTLLELSFELGLAKRDSAFGYGVDAAQEIVGTGMEAVGRATGFDTLANAGTSIIEQQQKDMAAGGFKPEYGEDLLYYAGGPNFWGALVEKTLTNAPSGGAALVGTGLTAAASVAGMPIVALGLGLGTTAGTFLMGTGEAAKEQLDKTGQYSPEVSTALGVVIGILDRAGARGVIPVERLAQMSVKEVAEELGQKGFVNAAQEVTKRAAKKAGIEGSTEVAQEATSVAGAATQGAEYTPRELAGRAFEAGTLGATLGGGASVTVDAAKGVGNAVSSAMDARIEGNDSAAAGDFARDLQSMIEVDNLDINDLDKMSTGGVREAVDRLHVKYDENMKQLIKDLRDRLQIKDNDPRDTVLKKVLAKVAYREARNKTKSKVGQEELQAVRELTGDTFEGQELMSLMRRMNELTDLHNSGYQGGISRITDSFSPLGSTIGYDKGQASFERLVRPIASISAGVYNPLVPLAQVGAVGAGRAVDALTGRRNRVQRYIKGNIDNPGMDSSNFPSLREGAQQQLMTQQMMAENQQSDRQALQTNLYLNDAAPTPGSPQDIMQVSTGLDRDGLVRMATIIARTTPNETLRKAAESAAESIFTGGRVSDMSPLIREINRRLDNVKDLDVKRVQEPVRNYESQFNERPGYQRGINDNRQTVDDLIQGVNADDNLSPRDKALLTTALETMRKNLGADPAGRVQEIADNTRAALDDPSAADVHLQPYVQRVQSQQRVQEDDVEGAEVSMSQTPTFEDMGVDAFDIGDDMALTNIDIMPSPEQIQEMRDGTFKPEKKRSKIAYAEYLNDRWRRLTGRDTPFEYTPENIARIGAMMATEALQNLKSDANAIGWYDRKIKAAKAVMARLDPRITESVDNEAAFDFALAVTSNGQAVMQNFEYAYEVFKHYLDTGTMPAKTWNKGGDRASNMRTAFKFYNAYQSSQQNAPIHEFLDHDFTVSTLKKYMKEFNKKNKTDIEVPSSELADTEVKGSFMLGAKIGQGFYQNIRGNYDPLTMDMWWMRMWNRLVGNPFQPIKSEEVMQKNRNKIASLMKSTNDPAMKKVIKDAFAATGENRTGLYKDAGRFDAFIKALDKEYQRFYKQYKKENGENHDKPGLFKSVGTHVKNLEKQLQDDPRAGERPVMRDATKHAISLLKSRGIDITTADFQALMWYPEKQLARLLGVAPGNGADNDYLDAAKALAAKEGLTYEQIQEALPDSERDGSDRGPGSGGQDDGLYQRPGEDNGRGQSPSSSRANGDNGRSDGIELSFSDRPALTGSPQQQVQPTKTLAGSRPASQEEVRDVQDSVVKAVFQVGKPGSPFENGIKDIRTVKALVEALGAMFVIGKNVSEMDKIAGKKSPKNTFRKGFLKAGIGPTSAKPPTLAILDPDYVNPNDSRLTGGGPLTALFVALHETGHILEKNFLNDKVSLQGTDNLGPNYYSPMLDLRTPGKQKALVWTNTFRETMNAMLTGVYEEKKAGVEGENTAIYNEIVNLQRNGVLTMGDRSIPVRDVYGEGQYAIDNKGWTREDVDKVISNAEAHYMHSPPELAADAIGYYLFDPQGFKRMAPKTAALIRKSFKENRKVQFFAAPVGTVLAIILANMMIADREDEDEKTMLAQGRGALTA